MCPGYNDREGEDYRETKTRAVDNPTSACSAFAFRVQYEIERARTIHKPINSAHEGYSIILEELDEFWDEVKKKHELRDKQHMYDELVQVAAMAQRTAEDVLGYIKHEYK